MGVCPIRASGVRLLQLAQSSAAETAEEFAGRRIRELRGAMVAGDEDVGDQVGEESKLQFLIQRPDHEGFKLVLMMKNFRARGVKEIDVPPRLTVIIEELVKLRIASVGSTSSGAHHNGDHEDRSPLFLFVSNRGTHTNMYMRAHAHTHT